MLTRPMLVVESVASDEEQARLSLLLGETVYRLDRIRGQGDQLLVENIRLPAALFPSLQTPVPRISELADAYALELGEALERVTAVPASADIAKALRVAEGSLLLMLDRVVHLRDGRPAEWRTMYCLDQGRLARLEDRLGL